MLIISSGSGKVFIYDFEKDSMDMIFESDENNEYIMGITKYNNEIMISSNYSIYFLGEKDNLWKCTRFARESNTNPLFAHIKNIGGYLFSPLKSSNIVSVSDLNILSLVGSISIKENNIATNFDNVIDVDFFDDKFYINCNSYYKEESCIIVLDKNLEYIDNFAFGWNLYNFGHLDGEYCGVCNYIYDTNKFPCLVVGHQIKFRIPNYYKLTGMSANKEFIFIVGSVVIPQDNTTTSGGIVVMLDRITYEVVKVKIFKGLGQFLGCLLLEEDLINDKHNEKIDLSNVVFDESKCKKIGVSHGLENTVQQNV